MDRDYEAYLIWTDENLQRMRREVMNNLHIREEEEEDQTENMEEDAAATETLCPEDPTPIIIHTEAQLEKENVENWNPLIQKETIKIKRKTEEGIRAKKKEDLNEEEKKNARKALNSKYGDEDIKEIAGYELNNEDLVEVTGKILTKKKVFHKTYNPEFEDQKFLWIKIKNPTRVFQDLDIAFVQELPEQITSILRIERICAKKHEFYLPFNRPMPYNKMQVKDAITKVVGRRWGWNLHVDWSQPPQRKMKSIGVKQSVAVYNLPTNITYSINDFTKALGWEENEIRSIRRLEKSGGKPYVLNLTKEKKRIELLSNSARILHMKNMGYFCHFVDFVRQTRVLLLPLGQSLFPNQVKDILHRNGYIFKWIQVPAKPLSSRNKNPILLNNYAYIHFDSYDDLMHALQPNQKRDVRLLPCIRTIWE